MRGVAYGFFYMVGACFIATATVAWLSDYPLLALLVDACAGVALGVFVGMRLR